MAFSIIGESTMINKRFKLKQHTIDIVLTPLDRLIEDSEEWLKNGFQQVFNYMLTSLHPEDKVGVTFTAAELDSDFHIPFKMVSNLKFNDLWELLTLLYQSNKGAIEGDTFTIIVTSYTPLKGARRNGNASLTFEADCLRRKGIISIQNKNDDLCLPRALVVAMAYLLNAPFLTQIRRNIAKRQDKEVQRLMTDSGIVIPKGGARFEELMQFQEYLKDYKITVYAYGSKGRDVLFEGPDAIHKINLIHHNNHFNVIISLTAAFSCTYFCANCHVPYNIKDRHRCLGQCNGCRQEPPCEKIKDEILCADCNRLFRGQACFDNHKVKGKNGMRLCDLIKSCRDCLKTVKSNRQHYCGEIFCSVCKKHQPSGHLCFIQQDTGKPKLDDTLFVFYDLETRQDDQNLKGENVHAPVLCVFQQRCNDCFHADSEEMVVCNRCGVRRQIIECEDVVQPFFHHLWSMGKKFKSVVVLAHNGQAYDHQFILRYILEKTDLKPDIIKRGSKLLMVAAGHIKLIDSLNYFPMKLAALPKAFDLKELKKGYFPHLYNTLANENYLGTLPDVRFYGADRMKSSERSQFLKWHEEHKNEQFDMKKEMIAYCISDVEILTQACLKFHNMLLKKGNISPFTESITLAGACNKLFRRNFMPENSVGIIPKKGYRFADKQSKIAIQWLIYEEMQRGIEIQHAGRQREAVVGGVKVDGYFANMIFEFYGCYFHGCVSCFPLNRDRKMYEDATDTLAARYERTQRKSHRLRERGYHVIEIWEHEFRRILDNDRKLAEELNNHPMLKYLPLDPRDAFYGGRTGCTKIYYKVKGNEKIMYTDVNSLYPWVCKYGKFPKGHPQVLVGTACKEGIIKCRILPPRNLYHPVLPLKMNNKLMFVLCQTCGFELNQSVCQHSDEQRALTGTWIFEEVQKAVEKGYKILEIFEAWEYDVTQYKNHSCGLFAEMINTFLKIKQEATGWPSDCTTEDQKNDYVNMFLQEEGIQLDFAEIVRNPGLRSLAKLILNSFWGKFGQRENLPKCEIIRQPAELSALDANSAIDINHLSIVSEDVLLATYHYKEEASKNLSTVNVAIAAYVTAQARLKLYSYLEKLGERVLYYDTDSVIYVSREGEWDIPVGCSLGEMTNELESYGPGSYITEFTSAGPKNYSFKVYSPKQEKLFEVCKVKGFNMNYEVAQQINAETMKNIVMGTLDQIVIEQSQIRRNEKHQLVTKHETKVYKACLEKRKFDEDYNSVPYGFKRPKLDNQINKSD